MKINYIKKWAGTPFKHKCACTLKIKLIEYYFSLNLLFKYNSLYKND